MATPSNKPRDIKNLKARLGRTITPGQTGTPGAFPGAPGAPAPGAVPGAMPNAGQPGATGASVPPPVVGGGFPGAPAAAPGSPFGRPLPAPSSGVRGPNAASGHPATSGAPAQGRARTGAPAASGGSPRVDPFAASAPNAAAAKRVTLVIDDSAVKEDEIGRKSRGRMLAVAGVCGLLGVAVGFGVGNTVDKRSQFKMAVHDGKDIYAKVQEVSKTVETAKELLKKAVDASTGGPGKKATTDFASVEQLVALKRPFSANEFHRRLYRAFGDNVVDSLFDYYNNINLLWDGFTALGAKTTGAARRDALQKSAAATDGLLNTDYGLVLSKSGDAFAGGLVFLTMQPPDQAQPAADAKPGKGKKGKKGKEAAEAIKVKVSSSQGGQEVERTLFTGQDDVGTSFEKYVFLVDKVRSRTILGESANLFAKYRADLLELNGRMDKTIEVQGRLVKDLGPISAMSD